MLRHRFSYRHKPEDHNSLTNHVWPGFVDALSALLTVILFAFMIFVVSYVCTRSIMQGKDSSLILLQTKLKTLEEQMNQSKQTLMNRKNQISKWETLYSQAQNRLIEIESAWKTLNTDHASAQQTIVNLNQQNKEISDQLEAALLKEIQSLSDARSVFFGELKKALQDRKEIRIVGDRFIFSSEILFDLGSASINPKGKRELTAFCNALSDIMQNIPKNVSWVLRIDGHTDLTPVSAKGRFKSNLELSTARAISVANFLISIGFPSDRLAVAGFGEFRPLVLGKHSSKDRRIELMFDQGY